ncbi:hypothetical protein M3223_07640 [Paenibacillus pasadenensis]|uniref:hypothetical protein n=1 Tax=Paenibacillus pasadenensis TaxID=217090 RepID=UPI00203F564E|nr:hypothetical protein [Paenibacillus pasadenensis]MCM3747226.1 hypothetical protein [Paenibacillus pasadenensis]
MQPIGKEVTNSSNRPSSGPGIIVILFILLVIAVSVFSQPSAAYDDPQIGPLSVIFTIINNSSYPFRLNAQNGAGCETAAPSIIAANGGSASFAVKKSFPDINRCNTFWNILNQDGKSVEEIRITMVVNGQILGTNFFDIVNLDTPIKLAISGTTVTFTNK